MYRGVFSANTANHRPLLGLVGLIYIILVFSQPQWLWALLCAIVLMLASWHGWRVYKRCWPRYGIITIDNQQVELHGQGIELSGKLLKGTKVFNGLVWLHLQSTYTGAKRHVFIADKAMAPEQFRDLARAVNENLNDPVSQD
ncbi:protein YgfX [Pseudoalteromonas ruthenica]|uniref:protein YgfX n=1 Tax=Pseudoalteromonas ruthenica TaxID=151081 RepID=UPI001108A8B6|nr:protein YgfX [Pseudoalteromonas ruthenica]